MLPPFDKRGNLPPGIHYCSWSEFLARFASNTRRRQLAAGLQEAMELLRAAGCPTVYIDGSFVSNKQMPADFDACWELDGVNLEVLDPLLLRNENRSQLQKLRFGGELFFFRLQDAGRSETMFDFFQADKATGEAKGIAAIDLQVKES